METGIELIKNLYTQLIRHNLSQPEEIDRILRAMAAEDLTLETLVGSGSKLAEIARNVERGKFAAAASFSYRVARRKSAPCLPDHYMFYAPRHVSR